MMCYNSTFDVLHAEILAVEAYQSGIIRALLLQANAQSNSDRPYQPTIAEVVQSIAQLRDSAAGSIGDDFGVVNGTVLSLVPVDSNSLVFARTPDQVIVCRISS